MPNHHVKVSFIEGELLVWVNSELGMILEITYIKYLDKKKSIIYISSLIFDPSQVFQDFLYFLGTF